MVASPGRVSLSPLQEEIVRTLVEAGGSSAYRQLLRACWGLRWHDIPARDRGRYVAALGGLEKRGFVSVRRDWGSWGYGQPEMVTLTEAGRACAA
jgi:hypothetical protein